MGFSSAAPPPPQGPVIDATTVLSLLSTVTLLAVAFAAANYSLGPGARLKTRVLFVWHLWDGLIHTFLEGSFLYNCFFTWVELPRVPRSSSGGAGGAGNNGGFWGRGGGLTAQQQAAEEAARGFVRLTPPGVYFLGDQERLYGSAYGTNPFALLWQEYAKADRRWAGSDLTIISLELLTVFIGAPLCFYICRLIVQAEGSKEGRVVFKKWFWMILLATGELYGGFMTFAPEWLTGSSGLDTSNWMYLWLYLVFFNVLWVFIPLWVLYEAYSEITSAMTHDQVVSIIANLPKKGR